MAIYFYVKKQFNDAISADNHIGIELDVFIPSKGIGIEYDGAKWHASKKKEQIDNNKNHICEINGIKLFRIREEGCVPLKKNDFVVEIYCKKNDRSSFENALIQLMEKLSCNRDVDAIDLNVSRHFPVRQRSPRIRKSSCARR